MRWLSFLTLAACASPTPEPFIIRDLRIVAMIAEPPEAKVGQHVALQVFLAHPGAALPQVTIGQCADPQSATCEDEGELAAGEAEAIAPDIARFSFDYLVPKGPENVFHVLLAHATSGEQRIDGFKRVGISAQPLNHNPRLKDLYVIRGDTLMSSASAPAELARGEMYRAFPVYDAETLELFITHDGDQSVALVEQPFFRWSCLGACRIDPALSYDFNSIDLTPQGERLTLFLVMRDGRGGEAMSVLTAPLR